MTLTKVDRATFLQNLKQSGLLTSKQFRKVVEQTQGVSRGRHIARALIEAGALTRFQAEHLLLGRTDGFFFGTYRILDQVGQGGMGRVYKALHQTMNRVVALKVLSPGMVKTRMAQKMFLREVQAAAQLQHPNIVTAYDAGQIDERHYLAMEYVDGPNLDQLVREHGPLPIGQSCDIIRQAAHGLEAAHELGMVHRDIKPANLLIQRAKDNPADCVVKILDFGLARVGAMASGEAGSQTLVTKENTVMGTPDFLSPEQARNLHNVDIRSDLYSLGCTLYYLLTAQVPYPGGSALEKLLRHGNEPARSIESVRPDVPPAVASIVRKLMAKNPDERFQNPEELALTLIPFAESSPPSWNDAARGRHLSPDTPTPSVEDSQDAHDAALVGTLAHDISATPFSSTGHSSVTWMELELDRRLRRVLYWALGIGVGIVAIIGFLLSMF